MGKDRKEKDENREAGGKEDEEKDVEEKKPEVPAGRRWEPFKHLRDRYQLVRQRHKKAFLIMHIVLFLLFFIALMIGLFDNFNSA